MVDPHKKRYVYMTLSGFGAISLSIVAFFVLYRLQGIGNAISRALSILAPFIYGGVIAYLLHTLCDRFEEAFEKRFAPKFKHLAPAAAVAVSMFAFIFVVYVLISMIVPQLVVSISTIWLAVPGKAQQAVNWLMATFGEDDRLSFLYDLDFTELYNQLQSWFQTNILPQFSNIVSGVGTGVYNVFRFLYNWLIGMIVAVYLLRGRKHYMRIVGLVIHSILPKRWANLLLDEISIADRMFNGFITGKVLDSTIIGCICYAGALILRLPNALLIAVIIGITNIIPFFGPIIGAVPATLMILMDSPIKALWFVIFVIILQQVDGNLIGPKILGNKTGLPSFWVLFAVVVFSALWGFVGMIIGVPVFAVIYDGVRKLVKRSLRRKDEYELWERYRADFPQETDQPPDTAGKSVS